MTRQSTTTAAQDGSGSLAGIVERSIEAFVGDIVDALPKIIAGVVFLALAAILVKVIMTLVRYVLRRTLPGESPVYRHFLSTIVLVVLWFGVALSFLSVVGLEEIAAALGTASGFLALGVAYALSDMIEDAVAGVYLLRDPDFTPGDTITVGDTTGVIESIELRKTRFRTGDDVEVRSNAVVEKRWKKLDDGEAEAAADGSPGAGS
ncbi:hypothetical protein BRD00_10200 [Halobacteriales archaeon QS_8_69_26]|nr:MAG: hypothetical protein BRD00_10200 [Halobacteriales archaeon QS_8_69_26]